MSLTKHKFKAVIFFEGENTIHEELGATGFKDFLLSMQAIKFILFEENT